MANMQQNTIPLRMKANRAAICELQDKARTGKSGGWFGTDIYSKTLGEIRQNLLMPMVSWSPVALGKKNYLAEFEGGKAISVFGEIRREGQTWFLLDGADIEKGEYAYVNHANTCFVVTPCAGERETALLKIINKEKAGSRESLQVEGIKND